jgi:hypothetical protein
MEKVVIGIAYHKQANFYNEAPFKAIQLGAYNKADFGIQKDSDGDNISQMNPYCSEMSATYWLWKNIEAEYKGLFHYRRFMTFEKESILNKIPRWSLYYVSKLLSPIVKDARYSLHAFDMKYINEEEVPQTLSMFGKRLIIDIESNRMDGYALGPIRRSTRKISSQLQGAIGIWHYEYVRQLIMTEYPNFFKYYEKALNSSSSYSYNMVILKNSLFDEYCSIMFDILNKYQNHMNKGMAPGKINQAMLRDSGYVAEVITDAFIMMIKDNGCSIKHLGETEVEVKTSEESQQIGTVWQRIKNALG